MGCLQRFISVLPRPEFLFSCANSGPWPNACDKQNFRVLEFLLERKVRNIQVLVFGCNQESAVQIGPIYFRFLRASVTPWCKGLFLVAATSRRASVVRSLTLLLHTLEQIGFHLYLSRR